MNSFESTDSFLQFLSSYGDYRIPFIDQIFTAIDNILKLTFNETQPDPEPTEEQCNEKEKEELLSSLGLQSAECLEADSLDTEGLFPDNILEMIQTEKDLYAVFKTFFPDTDDESTNTDNENQVQSEISSEKEMKRKRSRQEPFGEKRLPAKKARKKD